MYDRFRDRHTYVTGGEVLRYDEVVNTSYFDAEYQSTYDFAGKKARKSPDQLVGTLESSYFETHNIVTKPHVWNGGAETGAFSFKDYVTAVNGHIWGSVWQSMSWSTIYQLNQIYAAQMLAETNPGRSTFSVPVFIKELLDLPSMFAFAHRSFLDMVGSNYLNYRFGWLSFVQDVKTLSEITESLEKRILELQRLRMHGGLRRKKKCFDDFSHNHEETNVLLSSTWGRAIYGDITDQGYTRISGTVRWVCTKDFEASLRKIQVVNQAFRKIFSIEAIDPKTMWDLMPWSWLVDYFNSSGDIIRALDDKDDFQPYDICIMWDVKSKIRAVPKSSYHDLSITPSVSTAKYHWRYPVTEVFPQSKLTLLSQSQYSVLFALLAKFIDKIKRI